MIRTLQARPPTFDDPNLALIAGRQCPKDTHSPLVQASETSLCVPRIREVLVALDGTVSSEHALPWALHIAEVAEAQVRIVHVHQQMDDGFHGRRATLYRDFDNLMRMPKERYLSDVINRVTRAGGDCVQSTLLEGRDIADALAALTASADLTVMATRRRSWLGRIAFGSVSAEVTYSASQPLLIVNGYDYPVDLTGRPRLSKALIPIADSLGVAAIMPPVVALSRVMDGSQVLLRIVPRERQFSVLNEKPGELVELKDVSEHWRPHLPELKTSLVWSDKMIGREVLNQASLHEADFIALAIQRSTLSRLIQSGAADYLMRHAPIPLLVVAQQPE